MTKIIKSDLVEKPFKYVINYYTLGLSFLLLMDSGGNWQNRLDSLFYTTKYQQK